MAPFPSRFIPKVRSKLERFSHLAYAIAVLAMVGFGITMNRSLHELENRNEARARTRDLIIELHSLVSLVADAETGQRGYLLTGRDEYLQPFHESVDAIFVRLGEVRDSFENREDYRTEVEHLTLLLNDKRRELEQTIALRKKNGLQAALQVVQTDRGKKDMDEVRALIHEMAESLQSEVETHSSRKQEILSITEKTVFITNICAFFSSFSPSPGRSAVTGNGAKRKPNCRRAMKS